MQSEFGKSNGIRCHLVDHGGDGPTLLLTPGLTANESFLDAAIRSFILEET